MVWFWAFQPPVLPTGVLSTPKPVIRIVAPAIGMFPGPTVRYSDIGYPIALVENGTIFNPFDTFTESVTAVPAGGIVSMVAGTYSAAAGNAITVTKAMTIEAPVGTVVIGN